MILVAGLTPAWQEIMIHPRLRLGEVNRAQETHWCASGKAINVGLALGSLGMPSHTLSPRGGWAGRALADEFERRQIAATWIDTETPTRVCTTLLDRHANQATEIVENAGSLSDAELARFLQFYRDLVRNAKLVVLSGSLPAGTRTSFYSELLAHTPCPALLDARGPELLAALPHRPRLVKPNREELAMTVGAPVETDAQLLAAMNQLLERGAQSVVVTQGKDEMIVAEPGRTWRAQPYRVAEVVNPIASGDCLSAGLAWSLSQGHSLEEALTWGLAAAADNVSQLLPARLDLDRLKKLRSNS